MFKRIISVFVVALAAIIFLTACGSEFKTDGVYRAFKESLSDRGAPEVTTVSVTVKDGKITKYFIDSIQSTKDGDNFVFNEKSKKELGYEYGMFKRDYDAQADLTDPSTKAAYRQWLKDNEKLEWFEQAELIEAYWLENGVADVSADKDLDFDYVAGVTIADNDYVSVAKEAVKFAKEGKTQVITTSGSDLIWVNATVDKNGKFTELQIDTRQGKADAEGKFVWNAKSKQELGYLYGMFKPQFNPQADLTNSATMADYKQWLEDNEKLEWFEQVALITENVLANGINFTITGGKITQNDNTPQALTAVTITAVHYHDVIKQAQQDFATTKK